VKLQKQSLELVRPRTRTINGLVHISFRDVLYNILVNQIRGHTGQDVQNLMKKVSSASTKELSPRHRKRLHKQAKRIMGGEYDGVHKQNL
jgi:hypothetical protein